MHDRPSGWHMENIKAELRKRFGSLALLARSWGYDHRAISEVLRKPGTSTLLEERISRALGVPLHELWPDRWRADGQSLIRNRRVKPTGGAAGKDSQKERAA